MEIRRAILLFAIVLALAALVTSFTRQQDADERADRGAPDATATEQPREPAPESAQAAATPAQLSFPAGPEATTRRLRAGRAASLTVHVLAPGQVTIEDLGLYATAQPGTPARFDVLSDEPGRYPITFTPANGADGRTIGVLAVRE